MINREFISDSIAGIQERLQDVTSFKKYPLQEIVGDFHLYASLRYAFIELIERAIDINQHLIKELGGSIPKDYADTFIVLGKLNILHESFAKEISKSAGLRNIVVHEYRDVDDETLYNSIDIALDQYPRYCQAVLDFLKTTQVVE